MRNFLDAFLHRLVGLWILLMILLIFNVTHLFWEVVWIDVAMLVLLMVGILWTYNMMWMTYTGLFREKRDMTKSQAKKVLDYMRHLGHVPDCPATRVVRIERSGDTNDIDVFGECDCGWKEAIALLEVEFHEPS